jgi:hypothetical protein
MPSPIDESRYEGHDLLRRFCTALGTAASTAACIRLVADNADFVQVCRHLAAPPSTAYERRFRAMCRQWGIDAAAIERRAVSISSALRFDAETAAPPTCYAVLGVPATADDRSIKRAFREKAKLLHPDRQPGGDEAFIELQAAYHRLSDPHRRRRYDRTLGHPARADAPPERIPPVRNWPQICRQLARIGVVLAVLTAVALLIDQ